MINCINHSYLISIHPEKVVGECARAWDFFMEATYGTPFKKYMLVTKSVEEAWGAGLSWSLPNSDVEKDQYERELENLSIIGD